MAGRTGESFLCCPAPLTALSLDGRGSAGRDPVEKGPPPLEKGPPKKSPLPPLEKVPLPPGRAPSPPGEVPPSENPPTHNQDGPHLEQGRVHVRHHVRQPPPLADGQAAGHLHQALDEAQLLLLGVADSQVPAVHVDLPGHLLRTAHLYLGGEEHHTEAVGILPLSAESKSKLLVASYAKQ